MGSFKYRRLCGIQFYHAYFDNGIGPRPGVHPISDLDIVAAVETAQLFKRHGLRGNSLQTNGMAIFGEVEKDAGNQERLTRPLVADDKWVFIVKERNPDYRLLSDAPLGVDPNKCLYFTNATGDNVANADTLHLTKDPGGVNWQNDLITLHATPVYRYEESGSLSKQQIKLLLRNSHVEIPPARLLSTGSITQVVFDLQKAASGIYTLRVKNQDKGTFYFLNSPPTYAAPLAVIEIYWNNTVTDNYLWQNVDNSLRDPTPIYRVDIAARKSIWKYRIAFNHLHDEDDLPVGITKDSISNLDILSNQAGELFKVEQETNNRQFVVAAQQQLDWQEASARKLTLIYNLNNNQVERTPLPLPTPESLQTDLQANQLISPISLHL
jgi:hypothetical protein